MTTVDSSTTAGTRRGPLTALLGGSRSRRIVVLLIGVFVLISAVRVISGEQELTSSQTFSAALLLAVPIGLAALRVRGASFVIVSIALVLILLLVFQSWSSVTGGSRGLVVPRPFPGMLRPEHHRAFFFLYGGLLILALALLAWWLIDRSRFGLGLKAIREDEDKAEALGTPTFAYKLIVFVVSAGFTALAGGLYALWFGDLDPVFQFSILTGSYLVLMALLGGVRNLFGPLAGALIVGTALEYFKGQFGNTPLHLVATGVLLGLVVMFMPDGVLPAITGLWQRLRRSPQSSIREVSAADLQTERQRAEVAK